MPVFDYTCRPCGEVLLDKLRKADHPPTCPNCGTSMTKSVSSPAFHLAGGGWAKDGYTKEKS